MLCGEKGEGSDKARAMRPVLDPAARWSSEAVPELDTEAASSPHALIVDDLLLFWQRKRNQRRRRLARAPMTSPNSPKVIDRDSRLSDAVARYAEVGLEAHPEKMLIVSGESS